MSTRLESVDIFWSFYWNKEENEMIQKSRNIWNSYVTKEFLSKLKMEILSKIVKSNMSLMLYIQSQT